MLLYQAWVMLTLSSELTLAKDIASHPIILGIAAIIKDCNEHKKLYLVIQI